MMWLRKSKKGFTLIELMVVVAIIGVLALLGLRLYTGQQDKARNAIVKANVGTIQTLIQAHLADEEISTVADGTWLNDHVVGPSGIHNPYTGSDQDTAEYKGASGVVKTDLTTVPGPGEVYILFDTDDDTFYINGEDVETDVGDVYKTVSLTASK